MHTQYVITVETEHGTAYIAIPNPLQLRGCLSAEIHQNPQVDIVIVADQKAATRFDHMVSATISDIVLHRTGTHVEPVAPDHEGHQFEDIFEKTTPGQFWTARQTNPQT